ncbi:MAG: hypothetical protein IKG52_12555 [Rhodobacteraceae bacterium]|nr:hypothetical protein [Paracoccaceae bacterium]
MFTIEHDFDATIVTLVDEGAPREEELREDIIMTAFEDCVTLRQFDPQRDDDVVITLSITQLRDLGAALDLPEGSYRLTPKGQKR